MNSRAWLVLLSVFAIAAITWLWYLTQSVNPTEHAHIDSALRELRGLDRTINQDVLRARFQLIDDYQPVLRSYRRIEQLEGVIAALPPYIDEASRGELVEALAQYRLAITKKQSQIETFKYRSADLRELLGYLPSAGTGLASSLLDSGDGRRATLVSQILQLTLLYNLNAEQSYLPRIVAKNEALAAGSDGVTSPGLKRRTRTFVLNVRTLLQVKPEVDRLLSTIFEEPIPMHEDRVAALYYRGYTAADRVARRYRLFMYALCVGLLGLISYGVNRLQQSARALAVSNERLEERVLDRTRELNARTREMQAVLDNVEQALFTVDMNGQLSRERSAALDRWFPAAHPGRLFWEAIDPLDADAAFRIETCWSDLQQGTLPRELIFYQLPKALSHGDRHYQLNYREVAGDAGLEKVLVVITDVTEQLRTARREAEQQEQLVVFQQLLTNRIGFEEYLSESERLVSIARTTTDPTAASTVLRALHTLKGTSAMFGIGSIAALSHALETKMAETGSVLDEASQHELERAWSAFAAMARVLLRDGPAGIELTRAELDSLRRAVISGRKSDELLEMVDSLEREPAERRLERIAEQARGLARRFGHGEISVCTEANGARLDRGRWAPFWATFVHLLRNALDHGLESASDRIACGKPERGQLRLSTLQTEHDVIIEFSDDGRGIDWEAVRRKAVALGAPSATDEDLLGLLLHGGISTKDVATEISGRGAGVSACHAACVDMGGSVSVRSVLGQGTTFRFQIPRDRAAPAMG